MLSSHPGRNQRRAALKGLSTQWRRTRKTPGFLIRMSQIVSNLLFEIVCQVDIYLSPPSPPLFSPIPLYSRLPVSSCRFSETDELTHKKFIKQAGLLINVGV